LRGSVVGSPEESEGKFMSRSKGAPSSNRMNLTKPAQAMELRRLS
jgi:hypothetical protein